MHTEIRLFWKVFLIFLEKKKKKKEPDIQNNIPIRFGLSDLFSFVNSDNWSWSAFSGKEKYFCSNLHWRILCTRNKPKKKKITLILLSSQKTFQNKSEFQYHNNNNIPSHFQRQFSFGNTLPHKHSYQVQMWREAAFRKEKLFWIREVFS